MRRFLSLDDPAAELTTRDAVATAGFSLAASGNLEDRCIRYRFSDATVGRDMHTIQPDAWDIRNFQANPVFLWAHDDSGLPVGRVEQLETVNGQLVGQVRYAEHDFANTVYDLVKGGYLNATSTGWLPLEWKATRDAKRPGGLDFTRVELLEISQVPVPALPTALVTARSAGVDTRPLVAWAERLLDSNNFAILPRAELEALRKSAAEPVRRSAILNPEPKADAMTDPQSAVARAAQIRKALARGLEHVAELAMHLRGLEDLHDRMCDEAETEGDESQNPALMRAWLDQGYDLLGAVTSEESQEQKDGTQAPSPNYWAADLDAALSRALDERGFLRKGATHSAETVRCLRAVKAHVRKAHDQISALLDANDDIDDDEDPEDDDNERAARKARAEALKATIGGSL